jgi:hypothetical protein
MVVALGIGQVIGPAVNTGTFGAAPHNAGEASATINAGSSSAARSASRWSIRWSPPPPRLTWPPG